VLIERKAKAPAVPLAEPQVAADRGATAELAA
jgi:hypothetical protein